MMAHVGTSNHGGVIMGRTLFKSFDVAHEHYTQLMKKLETTNDIKEKSILFRRLVNLLCVMEFLISGQKVTSHIDVFR
jgi:hypothetical protein